MFSFERRCTRGDMIEVYRMFNNLVDINISDFFELDEGNRTERGGAQLNTKKTVQIRSVKAFFCK